MLWCNWLITEVCACRKIGQWVETCMFWLIMGCWQAVDWGRDLWGRDIVWGLLTSYVSVQNVYCLLRDYIVHAMEACWRMTIDHVTLSLARVWCGISELVMTWTVSWIASDIRSLDDIQSGLLYQMLVVWIIVDRVELRGSGIIPSEAVMRTQSNRDVGSMMFYVWAIFYDSTIAYEQLCHCDAAFDSGEIISSGEECEGAGFRRIIQWSNICMGYGCW